MAGVPLKTALFEYLQSDTGNLVALVGTKIYPNAAPIGFGSLPYVTYRRTDYQSMHHMGGAAGLARCEFRLEIRAVSALLAGTIGERLRELLDSLYGTIGTTGGGVFVQRCHLNDTEDDFIEPKDEGEIGEHRIRMDFEFFYVEALPSPLISAR